MPISKIKTSSILADAASTNLNIDAGTLFLDTTNNRVGINTTTLTGSTRMVVADATGNGQIRAIHSTGSGLLINQATASGVAYIQQQDNAALAFATNNTERMRVDASGNVGIGTASPATALHILKNGSAGSAPNQPELRIQHNDINAIGTGGSNGGILGFVNLQVDNTGWAADSIWGRINFSGSQPSSGAAQLGASILAAANGALVGQQSSSYIAFLASDGTNGGNVVERMRINSGAVGIGTTAPTERLHVNHPTASTNSIAQFTNGTTGGAVGNGLYVGIDSSNDATLFNFYNSPLKFGTNAVERMRILAGGNVGIGTSSPADMLDVSGNARIGQGQISSNATVGTLGIYSGMTFNTGNAQLKFFGKSVDNTGLTYELGRISSGSIGSLYAIGGGLIFSTASNNGANVMTLSDRMYITATGDVGIGTSTPGSQVVTSGSNLVVNSTTAQAANIILVKSNSGTTDQGSQVINFKNYAPAGYGRVAGTYLGGLYMQCSQPSSGALQDAAAIYAVAETQTGSNTASSLVFSTNTQNGGNTERMRITSSGSVLINTTTVVDSSTALLVLQSAYPKTRIEIRNDGETQALYAITFRNGNGLVGNITTTGSTTAFNTTSDYRLKRDVQPMTDALAKVVTLNPVTYKWKADGSDGQGFIAHELAEVFPDAVTGLKDEVNTDGSIKPQGIDTSFLVATLTAAMQEQQTLITQLTERIAALENK